MSPGLLVNTHYCIFNLQANWNQGEVGREAARYSISASQEKTGHQLEKGTPLMTLAQEKAAQLEDPYQVSGNPQWLSS